MGPGVRRASVARLLCRCGVTASLRSRVADTRLDSVTGFYYFHHCEFRVNLRSKRGLPLTNQILGWVALGKILPPLTVGHATHASSSTSWIFAFDSICSIVPFVYPAIYRTPHSKILSYFLAFLACFVILSVSVEGLFFLSYSALLVVWVEVEAAIRPSASRTDEPTEAPAEGRGGTSGVAMAGETKAMVAAKYWSRVDDLRIMFFLFFVQVAFFGTGNVASIS